MCPGGKGTLHCRDSAPAEGSAGDGSGRCPARCAACNARLTCRGDVEEEAGAGGADGRRQPALAAREGAAAFGHQPHPQPPVAGTEPPGEELGEVELQLRPAGTRRRLAGAAVPQAALAHLQHQLLGAPQPPPGRGGPAGGGGRRGPRQPPAGGSKQRRAVQPQAAPRRGAPRRPQHQLPHVGAKQRGHHEVHRQAPPLQPRESGALPRPGRRRGQAQGEAGSGQEADGQPAPRHDPPAAAGSTPGGAAPRPAPAGLAGGERDAGPGAAEAGPPGERGAAAGPVRLEPALRGLCRLQLPATTQALPGER